MERGILCTWKPIFPRSVQTPSRRRGRDKMGWSSSLSPSPTRSASRSTTPSSIQSIRHCKQNKSRPRTTPPPSISRPYIETPFPIPSPSHALLCRPPYPHAPDVKKATRNDMSPPPLPAKVRGKLSTITSPSVLSVASPFFGLGSLCQNHPTTKPTEPRPKERLSGDSAILPPPRQCLNFCHEKMDRKTYLNTSAPHPLSHDPPLPQQTSSNPSSPSSKPGARGRRQAILGRVLRSRPLSGKR